MATLADLYTRLGGTPGASDPGDLLTMLSQGAGGSSAGANANDPADMARMQAMLGVAQQYDPNASISAPDQDGMVRLSYDMSKLPKLASGDAYGQMAGTGPAGGGEQLYNPQSANFTKGISSLANPKDVWADPTYGMMTHGANVNVNEARNNADQHTLLDTIGPLVVGGAAGLGALAGGAGGGLFSSLGGGPGFGLAKAVSNLGSGFNPSSLLGMGAGALGMPSWLMPVLNMAMQGAKGTAPNPLSLASLLARIVGNQDSSTPGG